MTGSTLWDSTFWANPSLLVFEDLGREKYLSVVFFRFLVSMNELKIECRTEMLGVQRSFETSCTSAS